MADELIEFPKTMEVLKQLAEDVKRGYIENLVRDGHPTMYGQNRLTDTITTSVSVDGHKFTASLNMNKYWEYLEYGTGPARGRAQYWPPSDAIAKWIQIKPVIPRPDDNGRIPTPKQLNYLIRRKIHDEGITGTHGFEKTRDAIVPYYIGRLESAFNEDIGFYLMKVFRMNASF